VEDNVPPRLLLAMLTPAVRLAPIVSIPSSEQETRPVWCGAFRRLAAATDLAVNGLLERSINVAGFSKLYVIGGLGGFQGSDGVNPIQIQIWVGDADRQWLEPHYIDSSIKPMGAIRTIVPERPDDPVALLDACLVFFPKHFEQCPSLAEAATSLEGMTRLDFDQGKKDIPSIWPKLREEARSHFKRLHIFEAVLHPVDMREDQE
jgi:hypothetical protein